VYVQGCIIYRRKRCRKYDSKIRIACTATITQSLAIGLGLGILLFIVFGSYGLAVWYGGRLIIQKNYNSGKVINVIMAMMTGGM